MAACEIRLLLTDPEPVYHRGDTIRGQVIVDADKPVRMGGLDLEVLWQSSGDSSKDSSSTAEGCLYRGELAPGQHCYDFSIELNQPVFSYYGELFEIRWFVRVSADLRWSINPSDQQEFVYTPVDRYAKHYMIETARPNALPQIPLPPKPLLWGGMAMAGVAGFSTLGGIAGLGWLTSPTHLVLLAGAGGVTVAASNFVGKTHDQLSDRYFESVNVGIDRNRCAPGESFTCSIDIMPSRSFSLKGAVLEFSCVEVAQQATIKRQITTEHLTYLKTQQLHLPKKLVKGMAKSTEVSFEIPAGAAQTFHGKNNRLEWRLELSLKINRFVTWQEEGTIEVQYS